MITLTVPSTEQQLFLEMVEAALGPVATKPLSSSDPITIETSGSLIEFPGMYGEKPVVHSHLEGELSCSSSGGDLITPASTPERPFQAILQGKTYANGAGSFPHYSAESAVFSWYHYAWIGDVHHFYYYSGASLPTNGRKLSYIYVDEYTLVSELDFSATGLTYTKRHRGKSLYYRTEYWSTVQSLGVFVGACDSVGYNSTDETSTVVLPIRSVVSTAGALDRTAIQRFIDRQLLRLVPDTDFPDEKSVYGSLAQHASENILATNVNVLEFIQGLKNPKQLALKLSNLKNLKTWSSNYLAVQFGILPTVDDIQSLLSAFRHHGHSDRNGFLCAYASESEQTVNDEGITTFIDRHLKLAVGRENEVFDDLCQRLESIGVFPSFSNVWDLLPWSFAIDWLVDVGGYLSSVDARQRIARLNIRYVTMSRKRISSLQIEPTSEFPITGQLRRVHYHRWVSGQCPVPPLSLQLTVTDFDHWLESAALIIQRRPH